ncbi:hypothetical protein [Pseudoflavonifractor phocaeensis]|uniref:hypothetical protein n=1 Tax=Pseudoflavonifractor phocaeensis TaxID=1870988 RepID=UPI00195BDFC8|nr:hypothetical protein [Pseudoflavonifractor phocaeensis]MBM6722674.1 hypothetical protein [Pseudoflavonifractor phocaeensis]
MKKYFCSADEYQRLMNSRNGAISVSKKCLSFKPGTVPHEAHQRFADLAKVYKFALKAFSVREGSQRSPDGSLRISAQFQMDLERVFAEARHELWGIDLPAENPDPNQFPAVIIGAAVRPLDLSTGI